jgi:hypothetical protein
MVTVVTPMPHYFKPLRRKIGAVTLLVACVCMGWWARGLWEVDMTFYPSDIQTLHIVYSSPSGIGWTAMHETIPRSGMPAKVITWDSFHAAGRSNGIYPFDWPHTHWGSRWFGVYAGTMFSESLPPSPPSLIEERTWIVQHWSIVIPLTLLSAYLLLSKPRVRENGPLSTSSDPILS